VEIEVKYTYRCTVCNRECEEIAYTNYGSDVPKAQVWQNGKVYDGEFVCDKHKVRLVIENVF